MDYREDYDRERRYRGEGYYGGYYDSPREREWERRRRRGDDRGFLERAGDEVRSWFGDEDAQRRRTRDEGDDPRWGGPSKTWSARDEDVDRGWARQWGYIDSRAPGSQWHYRDLGYHEPQWSSPPQRYAGPSWTREGGYGREGWGDPSAWGPERSRSRSGDTFGGPHAGRGPRGYTRSDERIREDVCDRLCEHGFVDASDIEVRVASGEVTLLGSVRSRQEKRIAEDITEQVTGVRQLHNELRVNEGGQEAGGQSGRPFRAA
jgi:osmotically-inducible protein OsmY